MHIQYIFITYVWNAYTLTLTCYLTDTHEQFRFPNPSHNLTLHAFHSLLLARGVVLLFCWRELKTSYTWSVLTNQISQRKSRCPESDCWARGEGRPETRHPTRNLRCLGGGGGSIQIPETSSIQGRYYLEQICRTVVQPCRTNGLTQKHVRKTIVILRARCTIVGPFF